LELEAASPVRHEYVAGLMHARAEVTKRHNRIAGNISRLLSGAAAGGPCRVYMSDVMLRAAADVYYYPDVMVACGAEGGGTPSSRKPPVLWSRSPRRRPR
jgi:Uma2 family endonuclease